MGDWKISCCFCAGPFRGFADFTEEDDDGNEAYNPELLTEQDLEWLGKVQAIGFNPNSFAVDKCYITGLGVARKYAQVNCDIGDDPNVPGGRGMQRPWGRVQLATYGEHDPTERFTAPFHPTCFRVFAQALRYQLSGEWIGVVDKGIVDKKTLYTVVSGLHEGDDHSLKIDYGELNDTLQDQHWGCYPGEESWVVNPFQDEKVSQYLQRLKEEKTTVDTPPTSTKAACSLPTHSQSPLTKLADEIVLEILLSLPYEDIRSFVLSGITPINLSQTPGYWKRRIAIDMPFLWDLPELDGPRDFFKTYQELRRQCFATAPSTVEDDEGNTRVERPRDKTLVLGLANRRRVWNSCSQVARSYVEEQKAMEAGSDVQDIAEEIIMNSVSLDIHPVATPVSKKFRLLSTYFISSWEDLEREHVFNFHFNDASRLCGIEIETTGMNGSRLLGEKAPRSGSSAKVDTPVGAWITGFELNIGNCQGLAKDAMIGITGIKLYLQNGGEKQVNESDGRKRRMTASDGMVITGAVIEISGGVIQRIGLLQCPRTPTLTQASSVPQKEKCMWKYSIPPRELSASIYETGYWTPIDSSGKIPIEDLVFGTSDSELSQITGFSSDPGKESFGIHYQDGSVKRIGREDPYREDTIFKIDGKGGERITKVEVGMSSLPVAIKITTNRGRHCFYGRLQKNSHTTYEPGDGVFIAGIYASWGYFTGQNPQCTIISILSGSTSCEEIPEVIGVRQNNAWGAPRPPNAGIAYRYDNIAVTVEGECGTSCKDHW